MCGIIGYYSKNNYDINKGLKSIKHRGPDNQDYYSKDIANKKIVLGHVRLSIIDLNEESNQPFKSDCGNYILTYNGEIYNYKKLKTKLIGDGINFRTNSDTEVLLNYFIKYGIEGLNDLEGMFAFSLYDLKENALYLVRDQLGIKPLYYHFENDNIFWSSELKGIWSLKGCKADIESWVWTEFLNSGFIYEPDTGYKDTFKLEPGCYLKINLNQDSFDKILVNRYWIPKNIVSTKNEIHQEIKNEIDSHLVSDVPLGLFFSGGIDSSIILSQTSKKIQSFIVKSNESEYKTAGFSSDYKYAKKIAKILNVKINEIDLNKTINEDSDFLDQIRKLSKLSEEPIADFTFISSELLSKKVSEQGYKVMLSGMGADEIFAGYPRYQLIKFGKYLKWFYPFANFLLKRNKYTNKKVQRFNNYFHHKNFLWKYSSLLTPFSKNEIEKLLGKKAEFENFENKINKILNSCPYKSDLKKSIYLDYYGFLSHNFLVADKSSMQASLELRVPLATKKLFELTMSLDDNKLLSFRKRKLMLRSFLLKILPKKLVDRRKAGFHPPLDSKIQKLGKEKILNFLNDNRIYNILNKDYINVIINNHFNNNDNNTFKIYRLLYLSAWYAENKN